MSTDPIAILERIERHLRTARRAALDASDATAFCAVDAALDTVSDLISAAKDEREELRRTRKALLAMRHKPLEYRDLQCPATREAALNELGADWRNEMATWQELAAEQMAA